MFENKSWKNNIDRYLRHILEIEEGKYYGEFSKNFDLWCRQERAQHKQKDDISSGEAQKYIILWAFDVMWHVVRGHYGKHCSDVVCLVGKRWHTYPLCWAMGLGYGLNSVCLQNLVSEGWN